MQAVDYAAHNYSLFLLGVMILWFGWYGFNPGSALAILPAGFSLPVQVPPPPPLWCSFIIFLG